MEYYGISIKNTERVKNLRRKLKSVRIDAKASYGDIYLACFETMLKYPNIKKLVIEEANKIKKERIRRKKNGV